MCMYVNVYMFELNKLPSIYECFVHLKLNKIYNTIDPLHFCNKNSYYYFSVVKNAASYSRSAIIISSNFPICNAYGTPFNYQRKCYFSNGQTVCHFSSFLLYYFCYVL